MFKDDTNNARELRMNISGSVQAHRVSRIPGGDFTLTSEIQRSYFDAYTRNHSTVYMRETDRYRISRNDMRPQFNHNAMW